MYGCVAFVLSKGLICYNEAMSNRKTFIANLQKQVQVMGVSKNRTLDEIKTLHEDGITIFGENRVQELEKKYRDNQPWQWHFIGHLQKNKVKKVLPMVSMIHSVDSIALLKLIDRHARRLNKVMDILIQINVIDETTKFGCQLHELDELIKATESCDFVHLRGFMTMGPTNQDLEVTATIFQKTHTLFKHHQKTHPHLDTLSIGMSSDYQLALQHGATMVRLGTMLFTYSKNAQPQ